MNAVVVYLYLAPLVILAFGLFVAYAVKRVD